VSDAARDFVPFREHFDRVIADLEKHLVDRFAQLDRRYEQRFKAQEEAARILEDNAQHWRNQANEWRGALADRERDYLSRREAYIMVFALVAVFGLLLKFTT
jgi:hypothetical protein